MTLVESAPNFTDDLVMLMVAVMIIGAGFLLIEGWLMLRGPKND